MSRYCGAFKGISICKSSEKSSFYTSHIHSFDIFHLSDDADVLVCLRLRFIERIKCEKFPPPPLATCRTYSGIIEAYDHSI